MSLPTVEITKRIATMMHRKLTTHWSEKEYKQYKRLYKDGCFNDLDDLALMERYYAFERRRGEHGRHRRDLITLLNNWQGEMDRATAWGEQHQLKPPPRKIIPLPPVPSAPLILSAEDEAQRERFLEQLRARNPASKAYQPGDHCRHVKKVMEGGE
jgi:hypothetical protein